ncbi:MAG TPA: metal-dependent hydrolase [Burkholderiales bacterium]|nr:metal-dependent hydrolase [Burkholderiales bacterium]
MDTLTHALSGVLLARAMAPATATGADMPLARRMVVGGLAAAFPDLDFVASYLSPLAYLYYHRGVTHSLLMLPLWAMALGWIAAAACRDRARWCAYAKICAAGIAIHILGDVITNYGTMIFAPLSDRRYAWSTTFIIDLWFTGIIVAGLAGAAFWRRSRLPATLGLAVLAGYVVFQYVQQQRAIAFGIEYAATHGMRDAAVSATPRPVSPYNWMVIVSQPQRYHYALVNVARREVPAPDAGERGFIARLDAQYLPTAHAMWVTLERFGATPEQVAIAREAWDQDAFRFFRWFAVYPTLLRLDRANPQTCAWFHDLRFFTPGREEWPFRYGVCRENDGAWNAYRLLTDDTRVPVY